MEILKISALVVVCVIFSSCLPTADKRISQMITICACVVVTGYIASQIMPVIESVKNIAQSVISDEFTLVLKAMGINIISGFVSDMAADSGNKAMANMMNLAGKAAVVILALPVFVQVLEIIGSLII